MPQMKKQETSRGKKNLNEMEANNLPVTEFKTMVIRMLKELSENMNSIKKDTETIKKNQSEMKSARRNQE